MGRSLSAIFSRKMAEVNLAWEILHCHLACNFLSNEMLGKEFVLESFIRKLKHVNLFYFS